MTRLKVHNMAEGGSSQADISTVTGVPVRSIQRIVAEAAPTREEVIAGGQAGRPRLGRPRKADDAMVERIRLLLADPRNTNINVSTQPTASCRATSTRVSEGGVAPPRRARSAPRPFTGA
jgi:hypothetical protein